MFPGTHAFSGPPGPGKPPGTPQNGILAIKRATVVDFLRLKTFFRRFAGCPTVWEGSEAVIDQSWTPLGGGPPHGAGPEKLWKNFQNLFSKKKFWSKNTFYGFPGPKNVFLTKKTFCLKKYFSGLMRFSKKIFKKNWSKNTFYGFPGPKKVFLSKKNSPKIFFLGLRHFRACGPWETPRTGPRGPKTVSWP